ncbi:MAG: hypothetical protein JO291_09050 [Acidimicrobiia bacterium]|nr:hypothetical protein [Acidimicrobiia bacterium]
MQTVRGARHVELGVIARTVAIVALLGAAAVHFSLLGVDTDTGGGHTAYFAVAAWVQLGLALCLLRPSRWAPGIVVAAEAGLLAVWVASRTSDVLLGDGGALVSWRLVGITLALQGVALVAAGVLLVPSLARRRLQTEIGFAGIGAVVSSVALVSALLFSPAWRAQVRTAPAPVASSAHAAAHSGSAHDAAHSATGGAHAGHAAHKQAEIAFLFPDGDSKGWEDVENGVQHNHAPDVPEHQIPAATRAELRRELQLTEQPVAAFPTVAAAEAAGYRRAGPFTPGLGAHYVGGGTYVGSGRITDAQIVRPATLVYAGTDPGSPLVGFMYIAFGENPDGFAGPNDHWHTHSGICLRAGGGGLDALGADGDITEAACKGEGGNWMAVTPSLLHVWTVPSYTDPLGVFAHTNPAVACPDGTYYNDGKDPLTTCRADT